MKPLIGLPAQRFEAGVWRPRVQGQRETYANAIIAGGGIPVIVPFLGTEADVRAMYEKLDGLFLCGGQDLDPSLYGGTLDNTFDPTDPDHDALEVMLARWAMA